MADRIAVVINDGEMFVKIYTKTKEVVVMNLEVSSDKNFENKKLNDAHIIYGITEVMPGMLSFAIPNIIIEITNATPAEINTVGVNPVI